VVAVQSTGTGRAEAFAAAGGSYHVIVRGLERGVRIDRTREVRSVGRALAAAADWDRVLEVARSESLAAIVSNVTEAGYRLEADETPGEIPPRSFPGKLLLALETRFKAGLPGVAILPCELLDGNADRLQDLVIDLARRWKLSDDFTHWIGLECTWHNTLVDRIVSAPVPGDPFFLTDPLLAVAEPFALWLIEGLPAVPGLMEHPAICRVDLLEPYYLRKVRILNGAHTALVAKALPAGFVTVRQAVLDARIDNWLRTLLFDEIVPTLEGRTANPRRFAEEVLERFANPYLDHRLADIALHHEVKVKTRLEPTRDEFRRQFGREPPLLEDILTGSGPGVVAAGG
jgi:tagaturonate reductase